MLVRSFFTYMLASGPCGWLYVGVTNDLARRVSEHKLKVFDGYTAEHRIDRLVWFEEHVYVDRAILREKRIKRWRREWKFALVEAQNPDWADLSPSLLPARPSAVREGVGGGIASPILPLCGCVGDDKGWS